jgi:phytoene dehydrogenase-like protein
VFGWLLSMLGQDVGFPVPVGGAGASTDALVDRLISRGGRVACNRRVTEIVVRDGRAHGIRDAAGDPITATRAVLADVAAPVLYRDLVGEEHLPSRFVGDLDRFEWDVSTVKVDWALERPIPWTAQDVASAARCTWVPISLGCGDSRPTCPPGVSRRTRFCSSAR